MITKRKLHKAWLIVRKTSLNADLLKFSRNFIKTVRGKYKRDASIPIPFPTTLSLELTNRCNLHCITCPREYDFGKKLVMGNMDTALAKKIIDQTYPYVQSMGLTGMGETLFAPNLVEVAKYIKSKKKSIVIFISTNANHPGFIERITPVLPHIDTVQISVDGVGDTYDTIRHGGTFANLDANLRALTPLVRDRDIDLMFNMVITKKNFRDMPALVRYADEHHVGFVNFTYFNLACATSVPLDYYKFFSTPEFLEVVAATKAEAALHPEIEVTGLDFPGNPGIRKCPLMWNHFQINYDGKVPPCCAKPFTDEYCFGDVTQKSVIDVLNSPEAQALRATWVSGKPHPFCAKCHFVHL